MQLSTFSASNSGSNNIVDQLLPLVKPFAFTWFNLQAQKRKYLKKNDTPMPLANVRAVKEGLKATAPSVKQKWAERLLSKLLKDVVTNSRDDFAKCIITEKSETSCVPSQPDHQGKMRRIDCFKQADKIWRLDLVAVILFKGIPLENTDSERLERVESCSNTLCINPYHVLITCKELDLYTSYHVRRSLTQRSTSHVVNEGVILASVHSMEELLGEDGDDDDAVANGNEALATPVRDDSHVENKEGSTMLVTRDRWSMELESHTISSPEISNEQASASQTLSKKLPRLYITVQPQQQRLEQELNQDVRLPSQLPHSMPKNDQSEEVGGGDNREDNEFSQIKPRTQLGPILFNQPVLTPSSTRKTALRDLDQQPLYKHIRVFNPSPGADGMFFPFSNERNDFPQALAPSSSLASTLTTFLPPTSLNLPGPLFVLHPMTSDAVFSPPNLCTTISLTPIMASTPQAKLPTATNHSQLPVDQLGVAKVAQLSSSAMLSSSSSSSSASSSFNLDQFLDFGQQSSSVLPPINSSPSSSPSTFAPAAGSVAVLASSQTSLSVSTVTVSNKRGITRNSSEASGFASKAKRRRRTTLTGLQGEAEPSIVSKMDSYSETAHSDGQILNVPARNFLRADRQEGFRLFQSSGIQLSLGNQSNRVDSGPDNELVRDSRTLGRQVLDLPQGMAKVYEEKRESPSSDRGSPMSLPQIFTKELSTHNVPKPIAILNLGDCLKLAHDNITSSQTFKADHVVEDEDDDDDDDDEGRLRISATSDEEDDKGSSLAFNGCRMLQASPFSIIPISGNNNKQMMLGCAPVVNMDRNNSNPVLCCLNAGGLLSPTPPFNLSSSPTATPKTTPCSTPIPPRWCTPYFLDFDTEAYSALMVNYINLEEIYASNENTGVTSERRLQASSTPNILPIGQRLLQEGNRNEDENGGGSVDTLEFHKS